MNPKSAIIVVLVVFLATTSCLPSRRSSKDVLFKQFLREMQKEGSLGDLDEVFLPEQERFLRVKFSEEERTDTNVPLLNEIVTNSWAVQFHYTWNTILNRKSKRDERCDLVDEDCSNSAVAAACIPANTCEGYDLECNSGVCGPANYQGSYRR